MAKEVFVCLKCRFLFKQPKHVRGPRYSVDLNLPEWALGLIVMLCIFFPPILLLLLVYWLVRVWTAVERHPEAPPGELGCPACGYTEWAPDWTTAAQWMLGGQKYMEQAKSAYEKGNYGETEKMLRAAMEEAERLDSQERLAAILDELAGLCYQQDNYEQAAPLLRRAISIWEKTLGPTHIVLAHALINLAILHTMQERYAEADPLYQRALPILEKRLGPEHPDVAHTLNRLGVVYANKGQFWQAEPLHVQALTILEETLGPEDPHVAVILSNLGRLYFELGRYYQAEPFCRRSLAILEKAFGPDHPFMAEHLESHAVLLRKTKREAEAEEVEARAQAIRANNAAQRSRN